MTTKTKRAALYLRVSTDGQTTANQQMALEAVATQRGWKVVAAYEDAGISGSKGAMGVLGSTDCSMTRPVRGSTW